MQENFYIGWSKRLIKNGDQIHKVQSLSDIQKHAGNLLKNKLKAISKYDSKLSIEKSLSILKENLDETEYNEFKRSMPKMYAYNGKFLSKYETDEFPGSDMFFIDLDTTYYTKDILNNIDAIFKNIRYIRYVQRSISNKLHFICSFGDVINGTDNWEKHTVVYTIFILDQLKKMGYDFFALQDNIICNNENPNNEKQSDIIDTHNMKWTQRLFCTPYKFLQNPHQCPYRMSIEDDYINDLKERFPHYFIDIHKNETKKSQEFVKNKYASENFEYEVVPNENQFSDNEFVYEFRRKIYGALVKISDFQKDKADELWKIVCSHYTLNVRHPVEYYLADNLTNYFKYWSEKEPEYCKNINAARWLAKYGIIVTSKNDDIIKIPADRFLSDFNDSILYEWELYKKLQIVSPPGTGKTVGVIEMAKRENAIVVVPYLATNSLYSKDLQLIKAGDNAKLEKNKAYVMVYDQAIKYLPTDKKVIIDESHIGFLERDFRDRLIVLMNLLKNHEYVLLVSATPCEELSLVGGDRIMSFTKYHHKVFTTFFHYTNEAEKNYNIQKKIEDLFIGNSKYDKIVVMDDRIVKKLYEIYSPVFKNDILYFRANTREDFDCQEMLNKELLFKKLTLCTRAGFNGLNFNNTNERILLIASMNVAQLIVQQAGRFRNIDINLNIYVNDEAVETEENILDYYRAASEFSEENGAEFIIQDSKYDNEEFYKAKKQIVKFMNDNNCYDVCKENLDNIEYFIMRGDVNIMKMKGVKRNTVAKEISDMIKKGVDLENMDLNNVQELQYKRFKDAIDDFCKKYNIASIFDNDILGIMSERDSNWLLRLINSYNERLLIDSILESVEEVVNISSMDHDEYDRQNKLAQKWITYISKIPSLSIKTKENKRKLEKINTIRKAEYGKDALAIMDNLMLDLEGKRDITHKKKKEGGQKGGQKGRAIDILDTETNEVMHFETHEECIEKLNINSKVLNKIKEGKVFRNKKQYNKYKYLTV